MENNDGTLDRISEENEELRTLRQELEQALVQIDRLKRRKSSLMAMAAHDLRTPLAVIQGYSQLLAADLLPDADPAIREYIINIVAHADSLENMVENLVSLDLLEHGQLSISLERSELNDLVGQAIAQVEGLTLVKGLTIGHEIGDPVWANVDESRIRRVLYNLLSHATKYARPGSALRVIVDREGMFGRIALIDAQRQLGPDIVARLFDFVDIDRAGLSALRGMDMGLVLARQVAEKHNGRVTAVSKPHLGTTLALYLPAAEA